MHLIDLVRADRQYYITVALLVIPVAQILRRAGFKPFWAALLLIPDVGIVLCTLLLALRKWPQAKGA